MQDTITRLLTEAIAQSLKEALVPIVRDAVTEAMATQPKVEETQPSDISARLGVLEEKVENLESDLSDKVDQSDISDHVQDCIDSGSFSIEFRG